MRFHLRRVTSRPQLTNLSVCDKQFVLNEYWARIGGTVMLPGTNRAAGALLRFHLKYTEQADIEGRLRQLERANTTGS